MSTCADFSDMAQLLQAIDSLRINEKYDTQKLDSEMNEGYLKTYRRRVGAIYKCALKVKFSPRSSTIIDKRIAKEQLSTLVVHVHGRKGNDIVITRKRGGWGVFKVYLPEFIDPGEATFSPEHLDEFEYDDIKGHQVPNWESSFQQTKHELEWIRDAVIEMMEVERNPEGAYLEEKVVH